MLLERGQLWREDGRNGFVIEAVEESLLNVSIKPVVSNGMRRWRGRVDPDRFSRDGSRVWRDRGE